jgi:hypothetical protein
MKKIDPKHRLRHCLDTVASGMRMNYCTPAVHILMHSPSPQGFPVPLRKIASSCCRSSSHPLPTPEAHRPPRLQTPLCLPPVRPVFPSTIVNKSYNLTAWLSISSLASAVRCEAQHNSLTLSYFVEGVRCVGRTFLILSTKACFCSISLAKQPKRPVNILKTSTSNCSRRSIPQQSSVELQLARPHRRRTLDLT